MTSKFTMRVGGSNDNYHHISANEQSGCDGVEGIPNNE